MKIHQISTEQNKTNLDQLLSPPSAYRSTTFAPKSRKAQKDSLPEGSELRGKLELLESETSNSPPSSQT